MVLGPDGRVVYKRYSSPEPVKRVVCVEIPDEESPPPKKAAVDLTKVKQEIKPPTVIVLDDADKCPARPIDVDAPVRIRNLILVDEKSAPASPGWSPLGPSVLVGMNPTSVNAETLNVFPQEFVDRFDAKGAGVVANLLSCVEKRALAVRKSLRDKGYIGRLVNGVGCIAGLVVDIEVLDSVRDSTKFSHDIGCTAFLFMFTEPICKLARDPNFYDRVIFISPGVCASIRDMDTELFVDIDRFLARIMGDTTLEGKRYVIFMICHEHHFVTLCIDLEGRVAYYVDSMNRNASEAKRYNKIVFHYYKVIREHLLDLPRYDPHGVMKTVEWLGYQKGSMQHGCECAMYAALHAALIPVDLKHTKEINEVIKNCEISAKFRGYIATLLEGAAVDFNVGRGYGHNIRYERE
jgi:hypothetical protein